MAEVISGKFKKARIYVPKRVNIKPTASVVRRAIFDYLGEWVEDKNVLDLYAGTGALGVEALSRGARAAVFVEIDRRCINSLRRTLNGLRNVNFEIVPLSVFQALPLLTGRKFDLVFLDPPYGMKLVKSTLMEMEECDIVKNNSIIVAEHHKKEIFADRIGIFRLKLQKKYGETVISIFEVGNE
ncbi:MAG: 16S rRNA (guanine(966)-N(2))-methyltransferase RsmD [Candidatus Omnitrophota bacterium]|nr:MAG: 16S rRNA (guanine(966)-N(2))-methyltransferase RsmD [Candidatus Omnitrophota bacterium]